MATLQLHEPEKLDNPQGIGGLSTLSRCIAWHFLIQKEKPYQWYRLSLAVTVDTSRLT